jgi:hypothetical protein
MLEIHYPSVALADYIYMHRIPQAPFFFPETLRSISWIKKGSRW